MELSLVDLAPVPEGGTATEAFENTTERARQAEDLGYSRFWVAEHHDFTNRLASTTPEVLIAHLAAETDDIRIGSGTVLLNHYADSRRKPRPLGLSLTHKSAALQSGAWDAFSADVRCDRAGRERTRNGNRHRELLESTVAYSWSRFSQQRIPTTIGDLDFSRR